MADDNEGIRETTRLILTGVGYEVAEAVDGQDATEQLAAKDFDVAVLDVKMPKRDGVWVVENIDPEPPPPAVVMASAYNFDEEMRDRLGRNVFKCLRKPIPPRDLIEAVGQAAEIAAEIVRMRPASSATSTLSGAMGSRANGQRVDRSDRRKAD